VLQQHQAWQVLLCLCHFSEAWAAEFMVQCCSLVAPAAEFTNHRKNFFSKPSREDSTGNDVHGSMLHQATGGGVLYGGVNATVMTAREGACSVSVGHEPHRVAC